MRSLVFLSVGAIAAGFSFTGVPSSVSANQASSATLIRDSSDPTAFSLLLRLTSQNGGSTIQEFSSEQGTNIPFSFTPTASGVFIIEVISNLSPISDTQEPDKIYASSSSINVAADNQASLPSSTSTSPSSSENAGTSSSSLISNAVTSSLTVSTSQTTTSSNNNGNTVSTTPSTSTLVTSNGDTSVAATAIQSEAASLTTTNHLSSSTEGTNGKGALASDSSESSTVVLVTESSTIVSVSGTARSTNDSPTSTATLAPTAATSNSLKTGMIVGIILGILAFVGLCLALLVAYTRSRRRKRTDAFKRQLMTRQISPLVFNRMTSSPSSTEGGGSGDGDGYREYVPEEDYTNVIETGTVEIAEQKESSSLSNLNSMYSEQSVHSVYSDSPSVFYTAVPIPRAVGTTTSAPSQSSPLPAPQTLSYSALDLTFNSGLKFPASISNTPSTPAPVALDSQLSTSSSQPASTSTLPQLAPGWVFPRIQPRLSQLPLPKTDRQMDIYDRKVRLQGKLIGLQGWGNVAASESQKAEMKEVNEQIQRLEILENSDWALGRSNEVPIWGLGLS
ncbi:hypothetical protein C8J55DRAFT_495601 [Lentinula edodes]|uniref:Mid2 domain-containing protein n=1 Tax=Lentinula lateritia TaxID=40482 RepID=A0A9W9B3T1_9AGAR|nr:hypothetical protein C8J55DRAFT_495601 [Lentinula edodes]